MKMTLKDFSIFFVTLTFIIGCGEATPEVLPEEEMYGTQIMFHSNRDSTNEVYIMNPDGSLQTRITNNNIREVDIKYSDSQSKVVFNDYREKDIYTISKDGESLKNITNTPGITEVLSDISTDGNSILFTMDRDIKNFDTYVFNINESDVRKLVVTLDSLSCFRPEFSPNGEKIVFQTNRSNIESSVIAIMDVNGQNFKYISGDSTRSHFHYSPMFTPDGNYVVYRRLDNFHIVDLNNLNTTVINLDGGRLVGKYNKLEDISSSNVLLFSSFRNEKTNLFLIDIDGSNEFQLTNDGGFNGKFSPDESHIIFNTHQIYRVDKDGKNLTALTKDGGWLPQYVPGYNENE